jgi:hypothetical protein
MGEPMNVEPTKIGDAFYYQPAQVAEIRKVTHKAVSLWIQKGQLPGIKLPSGAYLIEAETLRRFVPPPLGKPRSLKQNQNPL